MRSCAGCGRRESRVPAGSVSACPQALWTDVDPEVRIDCLSLANRASKKLLQLEEVELPIDLENLLQYGLTIAQAETLDSIEGVPPRGRPRLRSALIR